MVPLQGSRDRHLPGAWGNVAVSEAVNRKDTPPPQDVNTFPAQASRDNQGSPGAVKELGCIRKPSWATFPPAPHLSGANGVPLPYATQKE